MEKEKNGRRSFLKYLLSLVGFGLTFFLSFKKDEGFKLGKIKMNSLETSKAYGKCGIAFDCPGGGGQCGTAFDCPGGGGKCGTAFNCPGGGRDSSGTGKCGTAFDCPGGGGKCGTAFNCAGAGGKCGTAFDCPGQ